MYANVERVVDLALTGDESRYAFPLIIPQNETERLLTEPLTRKGVTVERRVELVAFGESPTEPPALCGTRTTGTRSLS